MLFSGFCCWVWVGFFGWWVFCFVLEMIKKKKSLPEMHRGSAGHNTLLFCLNLHTLPSYIIPKSFPYQRISRIPITRFRIHNSCSCRHIPEFSLTNAHFYTETCPPQTTQKSTWPHIPRAPHIINTPNLPPISVRNSLQYTSVSFTPQNTRFGTTASCTTT